MDTRENHFKLTVTFTDEGNNSSIQITQVDLDNYEAMHPTHNGWDEELEKLAKFLS